MLFLYYLCLPLQLLLPSLIIFYQLLSMRHFSLFCEDQFLPLLLEPAIGLAHCLDLALLRLGNSPLLGRLQGPLLLKESHLGLNNGVLLLKLISNPHQLLGLPLPRSLNLKTLLPLLLLHECFREGPLLLNVLNALLVLCQHLESALLSESGLLLEGPACLFRERALFHCLLRFLLLQLCLLLLLLLQEPSRRQFVLRIRLVPLLFQHFRLSKRYGYPFSFLFGYPLLMELMALLRGILNLLLLLPLLLLLQLDPGFGLFGGLFGFQHALDLSFLLAPDPVQHKSFLFNLGAESHSWLGIGPPAFRLHPDQLGVVLGQHFCEVVTAL